MQHLPKWKVYPKRFDPYKAMGPPTDSMLKMGINWTEEDTKYHKKLEQEYTIVVTNRPPIGFYHERIEEKL